MAKTPQHFEPFYFDAPMGDEHVDYLHFGLNLEQADAVQLKATLQVKKAELLLKQHLRKTRDTLINQIDELKKVEKEKRAEGVEKIANSVLSLRDGLPCPVDTLLEPVKFGELKTVPEVMYYMYTVAKDWRDFEIEASEKVEELFDGLKEVFEEVTGNKFDNDTDEDDGFLNRDLRSVGVDEKMASAFEKSDIKTVRDLMDADEQKIIDIMKAEHPNLPKDAHFHVVRENNGHHIKCELMIVTKKKRGLFR